MPPSLRPWFLARRASTKPWYTALTAGIREPWASGGKNVQFAQIFAPLWGKQIGKFCREMVLLKQLAQASTSFSWNFLYLAPISPPLRTPIALTQKLCQNTSFLQLGGLIDWFYVVITIFAQHLNICSPKLGKWRCRLPPPGYTSGKCYGWLCGFDPFVAIGNP